MPQIFGQRPDGSTAPYYVTNVGGIPVDLPSSDTDVGDLLRTLIGEVRLLRLLIADRLGGLSLLDTGQLPGNELRG